MAYIEPFEDQEEQKRGSQLDINNYYFTNITSRVELIPQKGMNDSEHFVLAYAHDKILKY
ncbi:unnamed protein product, partial [Brachionus calyciflorus]